jgi:hypothetical protein
LFVARENGAEMVGRIGGHTAVMNNDQIVASVSAGVARAMSRLRLNLAPQVANRSHAQQMQTQEVDLREVTQLLTRLLTAVNSLDLDVTLDGESIKNNTVRRINNHTRTTGQLELIV